MQAEACEVRVLKSMKTSNDFQMKLDAVVGGVLPEGRDQTKALIESVLNAGGTSPSAFLRMARDPKLSVSLRADVFWLLPRLKLRSAKSTLEALLRSDPSERLREEAAMGLGLLLKGKEVGVLHDCLHHESSKAVRLAAIHSLGIVSSSLSAAPLISVLQDRNESPDMRADAAEALANVQAEGVVDELISHLVDTSPLVRYSAAYALGQQGDARALPALRKLAASDRDTTPWGAVSACALESIKFLSNQESRT